MSKLITAKHTGTDREQAHEQATKPRWPQAQQAVEVFKGGPPCPQYNSQLGCHLQSGHGGPNGRRYVHVCSFCFCRRQRLSTIILKQSAEIRQDKGLSTIFR